MRSALAHVALGFSGWSGWGPAKSWRRRLTPFGLAALAGILLAFTRVDPSNGWPDIAWSVLAVGAVVMPGCLIHFGPLAGEDEV